MKTMKNLIAIVLLLGLPHIAVADEPEWSWVWTEPMPSQWWNKKGSADVTVIGTGFSASLYEGSGHASHDNEYLSIKGEIKGDTVTAMVTLQTADSAPRKYTGRYRNIETPRSTTHERVETITLFDGFGYIALSKTTARARKDK